MIVFVILLSFSKSFINFHTECSSFVAILRTISSKKFLSVLIKWYVQCCESVRRYGEWCSKSCSVSVAGSLR